METQNSKLPTLAWAYGLAGLLPFVGCAAADVAGLGPGQGAWRFALLGYSAVILSFLGGGRWGFALMSPRPSPLSMTVSMAPSIAAFFLLLTREPFLKLALCAAAGCHGLQWLWDVRDPGAPPGYAGLRSTLTAVAVLAILGAVALG